eukprot:SAG11_NODE_21196_length_405_cov_0.078550_1_plen_40_part_10
MYDLREPLNRDLLTKVLDYISLASDVTGHAQNHCTAVPRY